LEARRAKLEFASCLGPKIEGPGLWEYPEPWRQALRWRALSLYRPSSPPMRILRLGVRDFRGFTALDLELEHDVTVLVGVNGAGKTSLLDAMGLLLTYISAGVRTGRSKGTQLAQADVRAGAATTMVTLTAELDGESATWAAARTRPGYPAEQRSNLEELSPIIARTQRSIADGTPALPLAVYFPTNRNVLDIPQRIRTAHEFDPVSAYDGALQGGARNFRGFFEWYREEEDLDNEQRLRRTDQPPSRLPQVRAAIEALFPGAQDLRIERKPQRMTLEHGGVRLDVGQLSDGEKCLLALAGDLARRMVMAAPRASQPLEQPAVVLIDEIELHLHPGLQRTIVPRLRQVFPNTQLIVSTHSPQVLSSVRAHNVRLLDHFRLREVKRGTWHRDTNRVLEAAFDDSGRPPEVARKFIELREAVDRDDHIKARTLIRQLRELIEGDDPDVHFLEQLLPPGSVAEDP
ncbi:MAG: AAA family ATPase, partial [Polyangiaceae bacterium]